MTRSSMIDKEELFLSKRKPSVVDKKNSLLARQDKITRHTDYYIKRAGRIKINPNIPSRKNDKLSPSVVTPRLEKLLTELSFLIQAIQEKKPQINENKIAHVPKIYRLELPSLRSKTRKYGVADTRRHTPQSDYSNENSKSTKNHSGVSRLYYLEHELKLTTEKESRLEIIQELANEGYQAAPILRRLIESENDPDIYEEAANVLMLILK